MNHSTGGKRLLVTLATLLAIVLAMGSPRGLADDKAAEAGKPAEKAAKKPAEPRGRLPAYYGKVVTESQRETIYTIQAKHREKIAALKAELAQLLAQQKAEIEAVLTPEQKKQLDDLISAAKAAAKKRAEERKAQLAGNKPAEE